MRELFVGDPDRFKRFHLEVGELFLDYSKNMITEETMRQLTALANERDLRKWIDAMYAGEHVNTTEDRAALHVALRNRSNTPMLVDGKDVMPDVNRVLDKIRAFVGTVRSGERTGHNGKKFKTVINIGIGGSDLGPAVVTQALEAYSDDELHVRFISNLDGNDLASAIRDADPDSTLFVVASKSFTTPDTLINAKSALAWLGKQMSAELALSRHMVAVSANLEAVKDFGIAEDGYFQIWDWVGGRYSLWSAIGLPIALYLGMDQFEQLLEGAHAMDRHFYEAPFEKNMPVLLALINIWYIDFFDSRTHAILPYDHYLRRLPAYLQQLEMESNGKNITRDGEKVDYATAPVVWGEPGTNGQHAFYQLIYQGTQVIPVDFLAAINPIHELDGHHELLMANLFAQAEAMMNGKLKSEAEAELAKQDLSEEVKQRLLPHKIFEGNRPSVTLLYQKLDARNLGAILALYEHKIYVEGVIWGINSFDQWGVELGKQLASTMVSVLAQESDQQDAGYTRPLVERYKKLKH